MTARLAKALWLSLLTLVACQEAAPTLRAHKAMSRYDLVGGPVAYADVGDYVLENDKVRIAILDTGRSWGPGVYGGSLVDADLRRSDARNPPGQGRDRFAELFPFANLLVPAPLGSSIKVLKDGSDGQEAVIRVEGQGMFLFDAIAILRRKKSQLQDAGFKQVKTEVQFRTDYLLKPGDSFVTMRTWLILPLQVNPDTVGANCKPAAGDCSADLVCKPEFEGSKGGACVCPALTDCKVDCKGGPRAVDPNHGCETCACSATLPMANVTAPVSVFGVILGDPYNPNPIVQKPAKAGMGAGDFVFFGNQNDIFVPGHGFDEEKPIWDALFGGRDTFTHPLDFDFVSAAGDDVSYAYFTKKRAATDGDAKVLVPVFTSAATAFVSATLGCNWDAADDATCETSRVYEFERYLAIGQGDIASVSDVVHQSRGTPTGAVKGYVRWAETGAPAANASVFVLRDPDPAKAWGSVDELLTANHAAIGSPGVINVIDADVGADLVEDGAFEALLPAGDWVLVAMDAKRLVTGALLRLKVAAGKTHVVGPSLPTPARIRVQATDAAGMGLPAKATLVRLDAADKPLHRDGGRRPYFGQGRLGIGVQHVSFAMDGRFDIPVEAGRYQLVVSHGIEYGISDTKFTVTPGQQHVVKALLLHEVDTKGWISGDFHLHAKPSFDSGMPLDTRVKTIAAEGVDYVASTDHDVLSDYMPFVRQLGLDTWLKAVVGSEISTLEIGHYIGFPLVYKHLDQPSHGSVDWYCKPSDSIIAAILEKSGFASGTRPTSIVAHPRDGFLGWADQAGINGYGLTRKLPLLEEENPVLRTVACDFDALEVFNSKRFDLIHTATLREVHTFERCMARIDQAGIDATTKEVDVAAARAALRQACPELESNGLKNLTNCPGEDTNGNGALDAGEDRDGDGALDFNEDLGTCRHRYRTALAEAVAAAILRRTPEEQDAWLNEPSAAVRAKYEKSLTSGTDKPSAVAVDAAALEEIENLCKVNHGRLGEPLEDVLGADNLLRPCGKVNGVLSDYFRFLEHGFVRTIVGGSDSHGYKQEPGLPRTWIQSATDTPGAIQPTEIADNIRKRRAIASFGPFLSVDVDGKGPGETAKVAAGKVQARVKVQTASWFGVDRVEVYVNGRVAYAEDLTVARTEVVDFDKVLALDVPAGRDGWIVVVAFGTKPENGMRPVYLDVPFGELQLSRVAALAFGQIEVVKLIFPPPAKVPDFYPVFPYAVANALLLDVDGNGRYDAPPGPDGKARPPLPAFCSPPCDATSGEVLDGTKRKCADVQADYVCLKPENRCGIAIPGVCDIYGAGTKGALRSAIGGHGRP